MPYYAPRTLGPPILINDNNGCMVLIGGQPVFVIAGSLSIQAAIGRRSQASFVVRTPNTDTHYQQYQQVAIYDASNTLVFSGYITNPKEQKPGFQSSLLHSITCADQHFLADKRVISASYTNKTCGFIVQDIVTNILAAEGVTIGQIYDGVTPSATLYPSTTLYPGGNVGLVPQANFTYGTVAQALDALVTEASSGGIPYYWQIDALKRIWFVPYTAVVNATIVDGTQIDQKINPPSVQRQNPTYRNQQYMIGGVAQTVTQTETRKGDGNTQSWAMGYDLASVPMITVDGVAKAVGMKGASGSDFYWAQGDPVITQDSGATKLTSSNTLQVVYIGQYPSVIVTQNSAQVSYQASIDGTSGLIEDVATDNTLTTLSASLSEASNLLTRYATQGVVFQFTTLISGYAQGQLINVNYGPHGFYNAQMLIESISAGDQADGLNIWYTITAIQGPTDTTWVAFWGELLSSSQIANVINVGTSQSTTLLQNFTASLTLTASMTVTVAACPVVNTTLFPSTALYPC